MKRTIIGFLSAFILLSILALAPPAQIRRIADFYFEAATGDIRGHSAVNKFGRNSDVDTGAIEDIWDGAGASATWAAPTEARLHTIVSTVDADASDAGGARTMQVFGLDSTGAEINETVSLSGTNTVTTTNSYSMIHRMIVRTAGVTETNVGDISATAVTDATVTAQINANNAQTLMAIYQIPTGDDGCITNFYASMLRNNTTGSANIYLYAKPNGEVFQVKQLIGIIGGGTSIINRTLNPPACFEPLTIIKISADASANNTDISAGYDLVRHPN